MRAFQIKRLLIRKSQYFQITTNNSFFSTTLLKGIMLCLSISPSCIRSRSLSPKHFLSSHPLPPTSLSLSFLLLSPLNKCRCRGFSTKTQVVQVNFQACRPPRRNTASGIHRNLSDTLLRICKVAFLQITFSRRRFELQSLQKDPSIVVSKWMITFSDQYRTEASRQLQMDTFYRTLDNNRRHICILILLKNRMVALTRSTSWLQWILCLCRIIQTRGGIAVVSGVVKEHLNPKTDHLRGKRGYES